MLKTGITGNDSVKPDCLAAGRHPAKAGGGGVSSGGPDLPNIYGLVAL